MGVVKFTLYLTTPVDNPTPLSHLNVGVGMIQPHSPLTINWRDCLASRDCKGALVLYLGQSFKRFAVGTCRLREHQKVILAGCFSGVEEDKAWEVSTGCIQPVPTLSCEAEEADTRVWLHVLRSLGTCKLVCSPDIDVHHFGLPLISNQPIEVFVCVSMFSSQGHRYLTFNSLITLVTLT